MKQTKLFYPATDENVINYIIFRNEKIEIGDYYLTFDSLENITPKVIGGLRKCEDFNYNFKNCKKVLAVEFPHKIEELYQFKVEDELEQLADKTAIDSYKLVLTPIETYKEILQQRLGFYEGFYEGFKVGYKANKNLYTEKQLDEIIMLVANDVRKNGFGAASVGNVYLNIWKNKNEKYLQSLNKPKEIENYEVEFYDDSDYDDDMPNGGFDKPDWKPVLKEGLIIPKVNYK